MGKRNKKHLQKKDSGINQDIEDEKTALEAIFGPDFTTEGSDPSENNKCSIVVVPHEAGLETNYVSATLHLTYVSYLNNVCRDIHGSQHDSDFSKATSCLQKCL